MKPLLEIGSWSFPLWHLWVLLAMIVGLTLLQRRLDRSSEVDWSLEKRKFLGSELALLATLGGWLGGRLLGGLSASFMGGSFSFDLSGPMAISGSWFVFVGGGSLWCHLRRVNWFLFLSWCAPCLCVALALGRLGCLFNGCDYGWVLKEVQHPFFYSAQTGQFHFPWPLLESLGALNLLGLFYYWESKRFFLRGWLTCLSLFLLRLGLQGFRGTEEPRIFDFLTGSLHFWCHVFFVFWFLISFRIQIKPAFLFEGGGHKTIFRPSLPLEAEDQRQERSHGREELDSFFREKQEGDEKRR